METSPYSCVFWSKDESDADLTEMAQRSAHVPGVTDTASSRKKTAQLHFTSVHNKQKLNLHQGRKKKEMQSSMTRENPPKKENMQGATRERPSLKDLRPEDKKRVANLIRELAKTGEEKEVAKEQLEVERRENEMKTKKLQKQIEAILSERETIQQQYLECQKLLSSYQAKVSEEQRNLSGSSHDGSSIQKAHKQNGGQSLVEERARTISPTSERYASKRDQEFMELQSVPVPSIEDVSRRNGGEFIDPHEPSQGHSISSGQQSHSINHDITSGQFNPVLSSTHRPHHRSRVPSSGAKDTRTAPSENRVDGVSSTHRREQSVPSGSRGLPKAHSVQRDGSRTSQETFLPLTEVADDSADAHLRSATSKGRVSRKSSDRNSWVSLPEMDGQVPSSYEIHQREQGQNENYLNGSQSRSRSFPTAVSDARFSKQRLHFEDAASFQYGDDYQTGIQANRQENARSNGPRTPGYDVETWQHRRDYRNLTPEQRQQQLGSLKKRLQQEQGWLQQKLQEQEQLLLHKRLEIQRQKEELSQLGESGYEQVRRKYLGVDKSVEQYRTRTRTSNEYGTGYGAVNHGIQDDGYHQERLLPEGGQNEVMSPWQWNVPLEEEDLISTNYPPDDFQEGHRRVITGRRARDRFDHYRQRHVDGYREDVDLHHQDDDDGDGDEMDGDETWYKMREETEGADNMGSIQGYVSLHPHQDRRQGVTHQSAPDTATFHPYQSYRTSGLKDAVNGVDVRSNRDYQSRISEPQRQFGNISALLEEERLAGLSLNGPNPLYTRPGPVPGPGTVTTPTWKASIQPHPSHSRHQEAMNARSASLDRLKERDKVTVELYTPQSGQGKKQRVGPNPSAGRDVSYPSSSKRTDEGHVYSYTDPAKDDALHAHLVQRSHQVIQEIGMLLDQSAEIGEQEESKVLEDVFFLK